ncbi:Putative AAA+ ATPase domain, P-loop containing nucleoside triphosphate hydrolase [Septoria linicola]|uniref:AAA+ ATPase domain, P-loop containing nucleoside triphosphate hydrolase n=1 Tax=Septoria linicola TaxID=215465 RepID=A0A9Q9EEC5_9PEZI|nr:Putative AAA+ ATPase domain, P-loop containing nucleoside triphosphate hydrolase [Septoria linicola]
MSSAYLEQKAQFQKNYLSTATTGRGGKQEEVRTSPLFSLAVKHIVDPVCDDKNSRPSCKKADTPSTTIPGVSSNQAAPVLPQYGLLGFHIGDSSTIGHNEPIMMNVNAPNSVFICGSQGSGKSYTLSALLENCLLNDKTVGELSQPVAGVVFHYDVDSSESIAEVANLCSRGIEVNVLVSHSNERALREAYGRVGSTKTRKPKIRPLLLRSSDLSIDCMNRLMAFGEKVGPVPLYMEVVQRILRQMAIKGQEVFDYKHFRLLLDGEELTRDQTGPMNLRFSLLESFMHPTDLPILSGVWRPPAPPSKKKNKSQENLFDLKPGTLTIIDLSDTFIDSSTVCILFEICLGLIKSHGPPAGLVVALDEAHKFLSSSSSSAAASSFTERLLTTIREQRHNATRVIIATQEPSIDARLLDLCSVSIVHRFSSPAWFAAMREHLGGASRMIVGRKKGGDADGEEEEQEGLFEKILDLDVGESLVFCPQAFVRVEEVGQGTEVRKLGARAMKMKTRARLGVDGGVSLLASRAKTGLNV